MRIGIIGAGNLGTAIAADLGRNHLVSIYSSRPEQFSGELKYHEMGSKDEWISKLEMVSNDYEMVIKDRDIIFITLPTNIIKDVIKKIKPFISASTIVGFVPGAGGLEFLAYDLIREGIQIFGFERVPYVARVQEYGKNVCASKKEKYRIAALPREKTFSIANIIAELFDRPCGTLESFISLTLTPTLHTSRLYDLYCDYSIGDELEENPYFYGEWRDSASYICLELDDELHKVCKVLTQNGIYADEVVPYTQHYESATPELLTHKLTSIESLSKIKGPLIKINNGKYVLDTKSRYFTESFPFRLAIVKGLADLFHVEVKKTEQVLKWYGDLTQKELFVNNKFVGKHVKECCIPQNYGIDTIDKLKKIYQ